MNREQIAVVIGDAVGNPTSGPVAEVLPAIADAIYSELNPKAATEIRVMDVPELR